MNTPRTDKHMEYREDFENCDPDFARKLETELIAMNAIANRLAESLDILTSVIGLTPVKGNLEALQEAFNQARQSFAAYENHKKQTL